MLSNISKLFTNEDHLNVHKIFGSLVLFNYFFQYMNYFIFDETYLNFITLIPHFLVHYTSFQFNVLKERSKNKIMAMFIWEELRAHSMIFAYRALFILLQPNYRVIFTFLTMIFADLATDNFGDRQFSTVRGDHNKRSLSYYKYFASNFFSMSQMGATIICAGFFQNKWSPILVFSTLPPIQTSAFGMTLIRKGIIDKKVWQYVYAIELLFVYLIWYMEMQNLYIVPLSAIFLFMRKMNMSKYHILAIFCAMNQIVNMTNNIIESGSYIDSFEYQ